MSKWYKKAAMSNDLTFVITTWLRNAKNYPEIANANDDLSFQMNGADSQQDIDAAINISSNLVAREQGGQLTPSQHELINNIRQRNAMHSDPLSMPQMDNYTDSQQNEISSDQFMSNEVPQSNY
jgi:hypothetical protein